MHEALIARLIDEKATPALIADIAMALAKGEQAQAALNSLRAANADRQARLRERRAVTPRNVTQRDKRYARGEKETPPDPHKKNHPPNGSLREPTPQDDGSPRRLPDDFTVPEEWLEWAIAKRGWSRAEAVEEEECFCRYWQAKGRDAARRSWKKTWQNWVVNSRRPATVVRLRSSEPDYAAISRKYA